RVVVAVDEVGDGHVGECGEPVGHPRRYVDAAVIERTAVGVRSEIDGEGGAVGGSTGAEVVQHHTCPAERHVPVVGLVQVVVQTDDGALAAVAAVGLDHLPTAGEPVAPVRLHEEPALIAVDVGGDDEDAVDVVDRVDGCHGGGE